MQKVEIDVGLVSLVVATMVNLKTSSRDLLLIGHLQF